MIRSMTAFGRHRALTERGDRDITAEIKSVNNRFLDCSVKLPRSYGYLEEKVKSYVSERGITRGKVDVYIGIDVIEETGVEVSLDRAAAESYIASLKALRDEFGLADDISVMSVAQNRDLFRTKRPEEDTERDWADVKAVLSVAIDRFIEAREREGAVLGRDIEGKIENIKAWAVKIAEISESNIARYPEKLEKRIKQLLSDFDVEIAEQRILTEAAVFADKASIDEELVRLNSHFEGFREILNSDENSGRKLDFLLQELNRETNTIASKSGDIEIARIVVDVKAELEKIREQIQNIE
ncbi:MAG: YicC family protein [Clostridia bacterium]|nr:YicC family protein [Clostridia bacterium]